MAVSSVVAGTDILVDNTDPANPIVSADGTKVLSVVGGTGISITGTATDPIVNNDGVLSVNDGTGIDISGFSANPVIDNDGVITVSAGGGTIVDNSDPQNPVVRYNPLTKTRCTYHFYSDTPHLVNFRESGSDDPIFWDVPATLYEENNIVVNSDGRLEMTGASVSPTMVKISWFVDGQFVQGNTGAFIPGLMFIYKNGNCIEWSRRRFVDPQIEDKFWDLGFVYVKCDLGSTTQSIIYDSAFRYTEGQADGSFITELENGDIIEMRGGIAEASYGPVTNRNLYNYSITITEL